MQNERGGGRSLTGISQLFKQFKRDIKASTGTDYTATVTRVEGGVAYVQLTGSDIPDTPATLSVDARPGDKVRVRVRNQADERAEVARLRWRAILCISPVKEKLHHSKPAPSKPGG